MTVRRPMRLAGLVLLALAACEADDQDTLGPNVATRVSVQGGDDQTASLGDALRDSVAVLVTNARDNPVSGATVTWTVTGGGGSVTAATSTTNAQGIAKTRWMVGAGATGENTLSAAVEGVTGTAEFTATAAPISFSANLTGAQVRPAPVTTPAVGTAAFTWNGSQLNYQLNVTGKLTANVAGAHLHGPQQDSTQVAPVILDLRPDVGRNTGTIVTATATSSSGQTPVATIGIDSVVALMRARAAYVDVHTATNPGGEIRGQVKSP